ncbi:uncharacterized protein METZ01_LOCUS215475 [marine metagenome]|uniref:Uncharacterized protein n=1 Tax=marine metagenome TaxID=408172 RepID=A0A382FKX7_9ZZZZ
MIGESNFYYLPCIFQLIREGDWNILAISRPSYEYITKQR